MTSLGATTLAAIAAATILAGCATAPADGSYASARSTECRMVRVDSASQSVRMSVRGNEPTSSIAEAEGEAGVARTLVPPRQPVFQGHPPGTGITERALREC